MISKTSVVLGFEDSLHMSWLRQFSYPLLSATSSVPRLATSAPLADKSVLTKLDRRSKEEEREEHWATQGLASLCCCGTVEALPAYTCIFCQR